MNGDFALDFILRRGTPAEEIGQLLERMDGAEIFAVSLWALPERKQLDEVDLETWPKEYIQCAGAANRLTVEIRKLDSGIPHHLVVGRSVQSAAGAEVVSWDSGRYSVTVQPNELLTWSEATQLFVNYYESKSIAQGFQFREVSLS